MEETQPLERLDERFLLQEHLADGGSASVHRALDRRLGRVVAVKQPRQELSPDAAHRFTREARVLGRLRHERIVAVLDVGLIEGRPALVTELVDGRPFADVSRPVDLERLLAWTFELLGALTVAHRAGVVHRDIKPGNIVLDDGGRTKLIDFGIADSGGGPTDPAGRVAGTPSFMSPEQVTGGAVDARTDLWSLGVVFFWAASGRLPVEGAPRADLLERIARADVPALGTVAPSIPSSIASAIDRALRPARRRYDSASSMARSLLEAALAAEVSVPSDPDPAAFPDWDDWVGAAVAATADLAPTTPRADGDAPAPESSARSKDKGRPDRDARTSRLGSKSIWVSLGLVAVLALGITAASRGSATTSSRLGESKTGAPAEAFEVAEVPAARPVATQDEPPRSAARPPVEAPIPVEEAPTRATESPAGRAPVHRAFDELEADGQAGRAEIPDILTTWQGP